MTSFATIFVWGMVHFLSAIPAGKAMGLPVIVSAFAAWAGYSAIGAAMAFLGEPLREAICKRLKLSTTPDSTKIFWRMWKHWGMPGLALIAPITCGPYLAALIALALGESGARSIAWISLAAIPWATALAILTAAGSSLIY